MDAGAATPAGNVAVFSRLTTTSFTLTVSGGSASDLNPRGALNALQIVETSLVPNQPPRVSWASPTNGATMSSSNGLLQFRDVETPAFPRRFYRALQQ